MIEPSTHIDTCITCGYSSVPCITISTPTKNPSRYEYVASVCLECADDIHEWVQDHKDEE